MPDIRTPAGEATAKIFQVPQAQYSLDEQIEEMRAAASKLGLYDAADWVRRLQEHRTVWIRPAPVEASEDHGDEPFYRNK